MKIATVRKFENLSREIFGQSNISSLYNFPQKLRFNLGGELIGDERADKTYQRAVEIFKSVFNNKQIWLRITIWDKNMS